jgi:hypothetical protein
MYRRPFSCFCPIGGNGPIQSEIYVRAGVDFPFGSGEMARSLTTGWEIQGGARVLFFTEEDRSSAWVADLGLVNSYNRADRPDIQIPLSVLVDNGTGTKVRTNFGSNGLPGVTVVDENRTFASLGFGKEWWYALGEGYDAPRLRWGLDVGGRYGSASAGFNEIRHRTGVIEAFFSDVHSDLEFPCGCCTYYTGLRAEYSYTFSNILQSQNNADVQGMTILATLGVRF